MNPRALTFHPGFLDAFALIAAIILIFGTAAWFLHNFAPDALAWLFPEPLDDDNDEQAEYRAAHRHPSQRKQRRTQEAIRQASLAYWAEVDADLERRAKQRWAAQAPRRRGQDLPPVESIGDRSLDELRRDFGGDAA